MPQTTEPAAIVRQAYDCFAKHDIDGILALIDKNCDWNAPGPSDAMIWAGAYHGPDEVRKFFDKLEKSVDVLEFLPKRFISDGSTVIVMGHERDRVKANGKVFEVDWAHCFDVENGKIVRFQDFQDTAAIDAALH